MNDRDFMIVAEHFAMLSTCSRARVGAILVRNGDVFSSGYNSVSEGSPFCNHPCTCDSTIDRIGHWPGCPANQPCTRAIHAETRAIGMAAFRGLRTLGATLYVTLSPCLSCAQLIFASGITDVVYRDEYRIMDGVELLRSAGVRVRTTHPGQG